MEQVTEDDWFNQMRQRYQASPLHGLFGLELIEIALGSVTVVLKSSPGIQNSMGGVHGGVLSSVIDSALLQSVRSETGPDDQLTTVELKVNFLRPAQGFTFECHGEALRVGRTLGVSSARLVDEQGRIVAAGLGTISIKRPS